MIKKLALEVSLYTRTGLDYLLGLSLSEFEDLLKIVIERRKRTKRGK